MNPLHGDEPQRAATASGDLDDCRAAKVVRAAVPQVHVHGPRDAAVDVGEAVVAAHRGQASIDRRWGQPTLVHPGPGHAQCASQQAGPARHGRTTGRTVDDRPGTSPACALRIERGTPPPPAASSSGRSARTTSGVVGFELTDMATSEHVAEVPASPGSGGANFRRVRGHPTGSVIRAIIPDSSTPMSSALEDGEFRRRTAAWRSATGGERLSDIVGAAPTISS
jgi:hypothetical protein